MFKCNIHINGNKKREMKIKDFTEEKLAKELERVHRKLLSLKTVEATHWQIEKKLIESERRFHSLAQAAPDAIICTDEKGNITFWNEAAKKIFGYSPSEALRKPISLIIPKELKKAHEAAFLRVVRTGSKKIIGKTIEMRGLKKDGTVFPIELALATWETKKGIYFTSVIRDITERKRKEKALRESEERYRSFLQNFQGIVYQSDTESMFFFGAVNAITGYSEKDFVAKKPDWKQIVYPDDWPRVYENAKKLLSIPDFSNELEYRIIHKNGEIRWLREVVQNFCDANKKPVKIQGVISDITEHKKIEERLFETLQVSQSLLQNSPLAIIIHDPDGKINIWNKSAEDIFGWSEEELIGKLNPSVPENRRNEYFTNFNRSLKGGTLCDIETYRQKKDGSVVNVSISTAPIYDAKNKISGIMEMITEITERKRAEEQLYKFRKAVETSGEVIFLTDKEGAITFINPEFTKVYGYHSNEVVGKTTPRILKSGIMKPKDYETFWKTILNRQVVKGELVNKTKDGHFLHIEGSANPILDENGDIIGFLAIQRDITERKKNEEIIRHQAYHDVLTELPNRMLFIDRLKTELAHSKRFKEKLAVFFLDLDFFKKVNDKLGHNIGDKLLQGVAKRLRGLLRETETVARLGGDEFLILLPILSQKDATVVAQKILDSFDEPWIIEGHGIHITTSIGIALFPDNGDVAHTLVVNSDTAMFKAKEEGRDCYKFYSEINALKKQLNADTGR